MGSPKYLALTGKKKNVKAPLEITTLLDFYIEPTVVTSGVENLYQKIPIEFSVQLLCLDYSKKRATNILLSLFLELRNC